MDYPTPKQLKNLSAMRDINEENLDAFIEEIRGAYNEDMGFVKIKEIKNQSEQPDGKYLVMVTGGWSGNEDVLGALSKSFFWTKYWYAQHRGGYCSFLLEDY